MDPKLSLPPLNTCARPPRALPAWRYPPGASGRAGLTPAAARARAQVPDAAGHSGARLPDDRSERHAPDGPALRRRGLRVQAFRGRRPRRPSRGGAAPPAEAGWRAGEARGEGVYGCARRTHAPQHLHPRCAHPGGDLRPPPGGAVHVPPPCDPELPAVPVHHRIPGVRGRPGRGHGGRCGRRSARRRPEPAEGDYGGDMQAPVAHTSPCGGGGSFQRMGMWRLLQRRAHRQRRC